MANQAVNHYVWIVQLWVEGKWNDKTVSLMMPHSPTEGRTMQFLGTAEGDFTGKITEVREVAAFAPGNDLGTKRVGFGFRGEAPPSKIVSHQFQVRVEIMDGDGLATEAIAKMNNKS